MKLEELIKENWMWIALASFWLGAACFILLVTITGKCSFGG